MIAKQRERKTTTTTKKLKPPEVTHEISPKFRDGLEFCFRWEGILNTL